MANEVHIPVCDFFSTEEQTAFVGAPARPGKIGDQGTNTNELIHEFISNALPKFK